MVASSFLETVFSFVHHYDCNLVLNKDENTHLERSVGERRREREEGEGGGGGRREEGGREGGRSGREEWEGGVRGRSGKEGRRRWGERNEETPIPPPPPFTPHKFTHQ